MSIIYTASGTKCSNRPHVGMKQEESADEINENTNGVISVRIDSYGDAPDIPYIEVSALSEEIALRAYYAAHALKNVIQNLFNESVTTKQCPLEINGLDVLTDHIDYVKNSEKKLVEE